MGSRVKERELSSDWIERGKEMESKHSYLSIRRESEKEGYREIKTNGYRNSE